jgi:hypothetical protein
VDHRDLNSDRWRIIGASVIGRSHERSETPCQDAHRVLVVPLPAGEVVVAAVADGAGSAAFSHIGALAAVAAATDLVRLHLLDADTSDIAADDIVRIFGRVRDAVAAEARTREAALAEFACTLLLLVLLPDRTLAAHIGDGAIVVDDGLLHALSWPEQGEYANSTLFLTMDEAIASVRVFEAGAVRRFALFSDGLQGLALSYATRSVFAPFIEPMLKPLAAPDVDTASLESALLAFLANEAINERTDDDKTLVLGVRRDN